MKKILSVMEDRHYLLKQYKDLKIVLQLFKRRKINTDKKKDPKKVEAINQVAVAELKTILRGGLSRRGLWVEERIQDRLLHELLKNLEEMGHGNDSVVTFGDVPKKELREHLELYGNRLAKKLSRVSGTFGKELKEEDINWNKLAKEAKEAEEDILALLSLLDKLTFKHSGTKKKLKEGIQTALEKEISAKLKYSRDKGEKKFLLVASQEIGDLVDLTYQLIKGGHSLGQIDRGRMRGVQEILLLFQKLYTHPKVSPSWDVISKTIKEIIKSKIYNHITLTEIWALVIFSSRVVRAVNNKKIDFIYALDRSARILGLVVAWVINRTPKSRRVKLKFIREHGEFYSPRQKKELLGENVLILDEYSATGMNLHLGQMTLQSAVGPKGIVYSGAFSVDGGMGMGGTGPENFLKELTSLPGGYPSWFLNKQTAGVEEVGLHKVKVLTSPLARIHAIPIRRALSKFANIIVFYIKCVGY